MIRPLDELYMARTSPDPFADLNRSWWLRRYRD
ncbi:hypothetical protein ACRB68_55450 [Actinomadura sp. RB68]|uniref:Uncharacterized protein n=1 Tax=Actinomadura macrotermitis TaxID=2585200 RepID=A0A7K0C1U7_9ACTN|nr:hypothetical protein [Actinomadura macrotermitis]